jgi:ribosomal protein S18 acetylase RimI-like enzyme
MSAKHIRIVPLGAEHDRDSFDCAEEALNRYLKTQATQDIRRRIANCFVASESDGPQIAGYYTIAAASISLIELPPEVRAKLPRYPTIPAVRIGRLAVDTKFRGRGLGGALLADAVGRVVQIPPAVFAIVVDAKNDEAAAFYQHYLFRPLASGPAALFLPVATAQKVLLA